MSKRVQDTSVKLLRSLVKWSSRLAGALVLRANMTAMNLRSGATESEIEAWLGDLNVFFILAIGRSGSMFLTHLLNQAPEAQVYHEPVLVDFAAYTEAFHNEKIAEYYLRRFRKKEIYLRIQDESLGTYGEVNTNLRRHCNALKQEFPNVILIHLVRDGRDVVRSMMSRRTFQAWDPVTAQIHPHEEDRWAGAWPQMDRFEKLCWYWMTENRYLRHAINRTVQFEKLLSDYEYFASELLAPLNLTIPKYAWRTAKERPKNVTRQYQISHWSDWDTDKKQAFERICGGEMRENGYVID